MSVVSTAAMMTRLRANRFDGDLNFDRTSKATHVGSISLTMKSHKHTPLRFIEEYKHLPETDRRLSIDRSHFHRDHSILLKVLYVCIISTLTESLTPTEGIETESDSFVLKVFISQDF